MLWDYIPLHQLSNDFRVSFTEAIYIRLPYMKYSYLWWHILQKRYWMLICLERLSNLFAAKSPMQFPTQKDMCIFDDLIMTLCTRFYWCIVNTCKLQRKKGQIWCKRSKTLLTFFRTGARTFCSNIISKIFRTWCAGN